MSTENAIVAANKKMWGIYLELREATFQRGLVKYDTYIWYWGQLSHHLIKKFETVKTRLQEDTLQSVCSEFLCSCWVKVVKEDYGVLHWTPKIFECLKSSSTVNQNILWLVSAVQ